MAITYTELIEALRWQAAQHRLDSETARKAADAIETLSKGINAYSDEAFKRAQECADLRRRITELEEKQGAADTPRILYICDRRACDTCSPECKHTCDPRHAKSFELIGGALFEL